MTNEWEERDVTIVILVVCAIVMVIVLFEFLQLSWIESEMNVNRNEWEEREEDANVIFECFL